MTSKLTRDIIQSEIADFFAGVVEIHTELGGPNTVEEAQNQLTERVLGCVPAPETEREPIAWLNDAYLARGVVDGEAGSEDAGPGYIPVYREAGPHQAPVVSFYRDGIEASAKWIDQQREAYDSEHGWSDPDTGTFEFGNDAQREYSSTLEELAEGIRALHPNAGNSPVIPDGKSVTASTGIPVIPDGYVIVPKEPTQAMCAAFNDSDYGRKSLRERYVAMLAAAAHDTPALNSVQSVATVPGKWVPVSERMPETDGNYWGWWSESKRQGPVWFIKSELQAQFQSHEITHWMPLPAAPQEVSNEK